MKKILTHNIGLKLISLILAIFTWFYIYAELVKGEDPLGMSDIGATQVKQLDIEVDKINLIK